ncbi:MAG: glutathione S-transferase family protein [Aulosira sp. DedVER01a]|nr:glutathione S-transferase family protein [Aulosira sp. DedVER01a]
MKLETWLRMAKIFYKTNTNIDLAAAPKGKIPFIEYQGELIGDSTLIIEMLKQKDGTDLDEGLTATESATSLAFRRMIKENIYWGLGEIRFQVEENWQIYRELLAKYFPQMPTVELQNLLEGIRQSFCSQMYGHGMGRHSSEEIFFLISADFQALSDFLAEKPFFMGDKPTTVDATLYAYVGNAIKPPFKHPIIDYVLQLSNLCQHYERMTQLFFSDTELDRGSA